MRAVHFHEDDYCQIEAVGAENFDWCIDQCRRIGEFAEAHRDGDAWTEMYMRPPQPVELATARIPAEALAEALQPHLPSYDAVTTGYSTHVESFPNALAFGAESNVVVFAEHRDGVIAAIWFTLQPSEDEVETAAAALHALAKWPLLLVDWGWNRVIPLSDEDAIREYLRQRVEVFADLQAQFERQRAEAAATEPTPKGSWLTRIGNWIRRG